ncbi:MAG: hypothetical protein HPY50_12375 [Firmicutes bacterium]|nr:hypothetical protein [Bacillota bacterium]
MNSESNPAMVLVPLIENEPGSKTDHPRMLPFPAEIAGEATGAYLIPGPSPGRRQYVLVNYHRIAGLDDLVLFYHPPWRRYLILPLAELPYYLRMADPQFDRRGPAYLEDMHLGTVVAVCQKIDQEDEH